MSKVPQHASAQEPLRTYGLRSGPHPTAVKVAALGLVHLPFAVLSARDGATGQAWGFTVVFLLHQLFLAAELLRIRRRRAGAPIHGLVLYRDRIEWRGADIHWRMPSHRIPFREIGGVELRPVRSRAGTHWFLRVRIMPPGATQTLREISLPIDWLEADRDGVLRDIAALLHPASTARDQAMGARANRR